MPGRPDFTTPVTGSGGNPVSTNATGVLETDNYTEGGNAVLSGTADYPFTVDEDFVIQEIVFFLIGSGKTLDVTTKTGSTLTGIEPRSTNAVIDTLEIDSFTVKDPGGSGGDTSLMWVGE